MGARAVTYSKAPARRRKKIRLPSVSVMTILANQQNDAGTANVVQTVCGVHIPGSILNWPAIAYKVYSGANLQTLVNNAFAGTQLMQLRGLTVSMRADPSTALLIAYKDVAANPWRVITGSGYAKGYFRFKELPYAVMLVSESDNNAKLKLAYSPQTIRSIV